MIMASNKNMMIVSFLLFNFIIEGNSKSIMSL